MTTAGRSYSPAESKQALTIALQEIEQEIQQIKTELEGDSKHRTAKQERIALLRARQVVVEQAYLVLVGHAPGGIQVEHH